MSQRCPPEPSRDRSANDARPGAAPAASPSFMAGLALGVLGLLDIGLAMQLAEAIAAVFAARGEMLFPVLAAIGCAMIAGAALAFTWLLLEDLVGNPPSFSADCGHQI